MLTVLFMFLSCFYLFLAFKSKDEPAGKHNIIMAHLCLILMWVTR